MTRTSRLLLCVLVVAGISGTLLAQDVVLSAQKRARSTVMAKRAARADAMRKLGERIKGLAITSKTTVKDFITESDEIKTAMEAFLLGMRETSPATFSDGIATVKMELTLNELVRAMRRIRAQHRKTGSKIKEGDISKMTLTNKIKVIKVEGNGAVPAEFEEDDLVLGEGGTVGISKFNQNVRTFWKQYTTPAGRLMAQRAARNDAQRRLLERIKGLRIDSTTTVKDFVAQDDNINTIATGFLRGAKEIGVRYHSKELICEVEMQVTLSQVFDIIHSWTKVNYSGDKMKLRKIEQRATKRELRVLKETGVGVPPEKQLRNVPQAVQEVIKVAKKTPDWATGVLTAVGNGAVDPKNPNGAQAILMAKRAADLDARRKLVERIQGLPITANTSVRNFIAESDEIRTSIDTFQAGAYVVDGSEKVADGIATVTVAIEMKPLWNSIIFFKKKLDVSIK